MKRFTITTLILLGLATATWAWLSYSGRQQRTLAVVHHTKAPASRTVTNKTLERLRSKATEAKNFTTTKGYNEQICFLVDMSLPSGQGRFFVYDLKKDTLQNTGLVTHGRCNEYWLEGRKYGNTVGCGCTSLGKYKIGYSYHGKFGLAFKLYGLDKTNDKAFARYVVLHAHGCVPETPGSDDICQSDGCPTVAPGFLQQLKPIIANSKKPVLLWIFE